MWQRGLAARQTVLKPALEEEAPSFLCYRGTPCLSQCFSGITQDFMGALASGLFHIISPGDTCTQCPAVAGDCPSDGMFHHTWV